MPSWLRQKIKQAQSTGTHLALLMRTSPRLGRQVAQEIAVWDQRYGKEFRQWLVELLVTFREREKVVQVILDTNDHLLKECGNFQRQRFQQQFLVVCRLGNQRYFLEDVWIIGIWSVLPKLLAQFDDQWIQSWVERSLSGFDTVEGALSQIRMETKRSVTSVKQSEQRVYLQDIQSRLWPYMESHLGEWQGMVQIQVSENTPRTDSIDLFLPPFVEGTHSEGWLTYRLWVARLTAFFEFGSFDFVLSEVLEELPDEREQELQMERFFRSFLDQSLAKKLFFGLEEVRVLSHVQRVYTGIAERVVAQVSIERQVLLSQPVSSPLQRAVQDVFRLFEPSVQVDTLHPLLQPYIDRLLAQKNLDATVYDTICLVQGLCRDLYTLHRSVEDSNRTLFSTEQTSPRRRQLRWLAEQHQQKQSSVSIVQAQRTVVSQDDMAEQLQFLENNPSSVGALLAEREKDAEPLKPEFVVDGQPLNDKGYRYPEWDFQLQDERLHWTLVREIEMDARPEGTQFWEKVQQEHGPEMRKIRSIFQMLKDNLNTRKRGLLDGDRLEFDRWLDARIQRKLKQTPDMRMYSKMVFQNRDPAVAFLVDLSSSTNEITEGAIPILDVEKSALLLMAEALSSIGDPFAIFGYSGFGREQVAFYIAKDLEESWGESQRAKVGSMKWKMENRDGAAIRHVVQKMSTWTQQQRILILLSDGKPLDCGDKYYFDAYAQADTREALNEARMAGITPFCITVDPYGQDYLPLLYGPNGFVAIENMHRFSEQLAKVYAAMTLK